MPTRRRPNYPLHLLLFVATVVTTVVAGMGWEGLRPLQDIDQFYRGLPFAGTLLAILLAHEMGHYLTARAFGMDVTLPYFIPVPPPFFLGTLGAFIRMRSAVQNRQVLLYVAAAGPIAGFCVALPAVIYACATSAVAPAELGQGGIFFGEPLLLHLVVYLIHGPLPTGSTLYINSIGVAAWFGLLVTMFNLMPVGQLDGGHIVYAVLGRQARYVSYAVIACLVLMGVLLYQGWFVWALFGWVTSMRQPAIIDAHLPLEGLSRTLVTSALLIFILCFMPVPISFS